jgi:hypothetical protein
MKNKMRVNGRRLIASRIKDLNKAATVSTKKTIGIIVLRYYLSQNDT